MLPNFLIIGAAKAGTTSLFRYLAAHPEVFMPEEKEPRFFTDHWIRGVEWYETFFEGAGGAKAVGEASANYSEFPIHTGVPQKVRSVIPDVKLIYLVRNPFERIRSHYLQDAAAGLEDSPLEVAIRTNPFLLAATRYSTQIDLYMDHFARSQMLVLVSEDLRAQRSKVLREVYEFLGVDPEWVDPIQQHEFNTLDERRLVRPAIERARRNRVYKTLTSAVPLPAKRLLDTRTNVLRQHVSRVADASLSSESLEWVKEELRADIEGLRRYLGAAFHCWGFLESAAPSA